nr:nicalin-1-like isoform X2 [Tanacetum cinerariifolium]
VLADIKRNDAAGQPATATTGGYKLIVSSPAPKKLSSPTITNIQVAWEHEQFSRLRVIAATLSGLSAPPELLESTGGLSDNREFVNEAAVVKRVKVVAESLATFAYYIKYISLFRM